MAKRSTVTPTSTATTKTVKDEFGNEREVHDGKSFNMNKRCCIEGAQAKAEGKTAADNPYNVGSQSHSRWARGWKSGTVPEKPKKAAKKAAKKAPKKVAKKAAKKKATTAKSRVTKSKS